MSTGQAPGHDISGWHEVHFGWPVKIMAKPEIGGKGLAANNFVAQWTIIRNFACRNGTDAWYLQNPGKAIRSGGL